MPVGKRKRPAISYVQESSDEDFSAGASEEEQAAAVANTVTPRPVLTHFNTITELVSKIKLARRIVVVVGAGISVSCGIPDFRSDNGIYKLAQKLDLGLSQPEDLFDLEAFTNDPKPFFKFAKALYPGEHQPSLTHWFLKALEDRGKLLRVYSQNIDGLEQQVGLKKAIACHGSFVGATCLECRKKYTSDDIKPQVMRQEVPLCPSCKEGVIKPDITFFGERLPGTINRSVDADARVADLVLVMGTSLKVAPVSKIIQRMPRSAPQVLFNRELVRPPRRLSCGFDLHLLGDCDAAVAHLVSRLAWTMPEGCPAAAAARALGLKKAAPSAAQALPKGAKGVPKGGAKKGQAPPSTTKRAAAAAAKEGKRAAAAAAAAAAAEATAAAARAPRRIPPNAYMFAGGVSPRGGGGGDASSRDADDAAEVVTCDGCERRLDARCAVFSCARCFDFDLCGTCHPKRKRLHNRKHAFARTDRRAASPPVPAAAAALRA